MGKSLWVQLKGRRERGLKECKNRNFNSKSKYQISILTLLLHSAY